MATANGNVHVETAESFARDYLDDLLNNNKNLGAFEEETLDLNIKSKYDDLQSEPDKEETNIGYEVVETVYVTNGTTNGIDSFSSAQTAPVEEPLEPSVQTFTVNGHENDFLQNGTLSDHGENSNEVVEPNHLQFNSQLDVVENGSAFEEKKETDVFEEKVETNAADAFEEKKETDVFEEKVETNAANAFELKKETIAVETPVQPVSNFTNPAEEEEEEEEDQVTELKLKKVGISKDWWDAKPQESQNVDKFRTIKQNIRKGNTRSLLDRFENLSKVTE